MTTNNSFHSFLSSSKDNRILSLRTLDNVFKLICFIFEKTSECRISSQILHKMFRSHLLSTKITSYKLSPSLLNQ